jgi:hypothetical protein
MASNLDWVITPWRNTNELVKARDLLYPTSEGQHIERADGDHGDTVGLEGRRKKYLGVRLVSKLYCIRTCSQSSFGLLETSDRFLEGKACFIQCYFGQFVDSSSFRCYTYSNLYKHAKSLNLW